VLDGHCACTGCFGIKNANPSHAHCAKTEGLKCGDFEIEVEISQMRSFSLKVIPQR